MRHYTLIFTNLICILLIACAVQSMAQDEPAKQDLIEVDLDTVDVGTFVRFVGAHTGKRFTISPDVARKITITPTQVARSKLYNFFLSVLDTAGCSVSEKEGIYHVALLSDENQPFPLVLGPDDKVENQGLVTKVFRLKYVNAGELKRALDPKMRGGKAGAISAMEETNHLILTASSSTVKQVQKIIDEVDQSNLSHAYKVIQLKHASAVEIARQLTDAIARQQGRGQSLRQRLPNTTGSSFEVRDVAIVAAPHSNGIILVGPETRVNDLEEIVAAMDIEPQSGRGRLNAIFLNHILAEEAVKELQGLLGQQLSTSPGKQGITPASTGARMSVHASLENNAILVDASALDFKELASLIDQLDKSPKQVLIEVMLIEHTINDSLDLGVDFASLDIPSAVGDTVVSGNLKLGQGGQSLLQNIQDGLLPDGLSVAVAQGARLDADGNVESSFPAAVNITAIDQNSDIHIISKTLLPARNNREAEMNIVENIPILKSTIQGGTGSARDVIQNIERTDVGIKLSMTPHINPADSVNLELSTSIEAVLASTDPAASLTPTIARRDVTTTVTVDDGQTVVLSGLVREDDTELERKLPFLGDIPILGHLFKHTVESKERINLMIFVTPHVIAANKSEADVRKRWEETTGINPDDAESSLKKGNDENK